LKDTTKNTYKEIRMGSKCDTCKYNDIAYGKQFWNCTHPIPCEERKISELGCEYAELLEKEIGGERMVNKSGIIPGDKVLKKIGENRTKFNVDISKEAKEKRTINGFTFDSDDEADYFEEIILTDETITSYIVHPKYILQESFEKYGRKFYKVEYEADFEITRGFKITAIDVKGSPTETAILKRKLFDKRYPHIVLEWVAYSKMDGGWVDYDKLQKLRAERRKAKKKAQEEYKKSLILP